MGGAAMERDHDGAPGHGLDLLSPAERRVLEYVRQGTLDAEIAVRLGVPVGDVKERVASMLQKLNLPDRAALAAWDPSQLPASQPRAVEPVVTEPAEPAAPTPELPPRFSWRLDPGTMASLVIVALLVTGSLAYLLWPKSEEGTPARASAPRGRWQTAVAVEPSPGGAATPGGSPVATITPVRRFDSLREGQPVTLPGTVQLLVLGPCPPLSERCPGGERRLSWTHWDAGVPVGFPAFEPGGERLVDAIASPGGEAIVVLTCLGQCSGREAEGQWRLHRSLDWGVTWETSPAATGPIAVAGLVGTDPIVMRPSGASVYDFATNSYRDYSGRPPERLFHSAFDARLSLSDDGRRLLAADGSPVLDPRLPPGARIVSFLVGDHAGEYFVFDGARLYWFRYGRLEAMAPVDGPLELIRPLGNGTVLANVLRGGMLGPVTIDLNIGAIAPLKELANGGMVVIAVRTGFAQVTVVGAGDCLNVRSAPNTGSPILGCFPDGSRLTLGTVAFVDSEDPNLRWLQVALADGRVGYPRSDFLSDPGIAIPTLPNDGPR